MKRYLSVRGPLVCALSQTNEQLCVSVSFLIDAAQRRGESKISKGLIRERNLGSLTHGILKKEEENKSKRNHS